MLESGTVGVLGFMGLRITVTKSTGDASSDVVGFGLGFGG